MAPDVTVVLNIHRETAYIYRTMRSLDEAASFARHEGIRCELVIVFDRSDDRTRQVAMSAICPGFDQIQYIEADHGSLGPSRNTGIAAASGEYVWLADADDLVSYNCIAAMYGIAASRSKAVVFPQYLVQFGERYGVSKYFDDDVIDAVDFVYDHPYISRIFLRRDVFDNLNFDDVRLSRGFAYEDWHLNCELKARGFRFLIAPRTVFYYRQRKGSLLRQADAISVKQIPGNSLSTPDVLIRRVAEEQGRRANESVRLTAKELARQTSPKWELLSDPLCMEMTYAAIRIDPSMNFKSIEGGGSWVTVFPDHHWGHDYLAVCEMIGPGTFSDIVLLPSLNAGGGERYILGVLDSIAAQSESFRCLVIAGEAADRHDWVDRIPVNSVFLDVVNMFPHLGMADRDKLVLRLALSVARKGARIHLKDSYFAIRWFSTFSPCTHSLFSIYYRFSDQAEWKNGSRLAQGSSCGFISSEFDELSMMMTDHRKVIAHDARVFGTGVEKWQCVYASVPSKALTSTSKDLPTLKLLWASRLCREKRPEILAMIASEARKLFPKLCIFVHGIADPEYAVAEFLSETPGLEYLGPFQSFDELQPEGYDALIYTSAYDGLPNTILEAMSWGLPVIAPDIGGISEVVRDGVTGFLVQDERDDGQLVKSYLGSIGRLYEDWDRTQSMARAAKAHVEANHSPEGHRARIRQLLLKGESL